MTSIESLKSHVKAVGGEITDELADILIEDAKTVFTTLTKRKNYDSWGNALTRIAFAQWQLLGDEPKKNYSVGDVSTSFHKLEDMVKPYLPKPLVNVGGSVFEHVDTKQTV